MCYAYIIRHIPTEIWNIGYNCWDQQIQKQIRFVILEKYTEN